MYVSAWAASSIPFATALRNAAIPNTWTDIQTFNARKERLTWSPRFVKFGWFAPHTVSWRMSGRIPNAPSSDLASLTIRHPASYGWKNHLCASNPTESARSIPRNSFLPASVTTANPPYAASACSHMPSDSQ